MSIVGWKIYRFEYVSRPRFDEDPNLIWRGPYHVATVRADGTWSHRFGSTGNDVYFAIHPTLGTIDSNTIKTSRFAKFTYEKRVEYEFAFQPGRTVTPFALPGDAGAMVFDMKMRPISIIIAGIPSVIPPNKPSQYLIDQFDFSNYFAKRNPKATYIQAGKGVGPVNSALVDRYAEVGTITAGDHGDFNIITLGVSVERAIKIFKLKPFTL